ncbi:MAG TPA: hypothetical protein VII87_03765, partial [Solirubrobacteraceae bacterium]
MRPDVHRAASGRTPSTSRRHRLRAPLGVFAVALIVALALAPEAMANFLTPKSGGSPNANEIDSL